VSQTRPAVALAAAGLIALALAACGSSESESSATPAASHEAVPAGIQHAVDAYKKYTAPQPPVPVEALPDRPPQGKSIAITTCAIPVCRNTTDAAVAAAKALGWKVNYVVYAPTPQGYAQSWTKILQNPPDLIAFSGIFPDEVVAEQLAKARSLKIPMVDMAPANGVPTEGVAAVTAGSEMFRLDGVLMADAIAADAKQKANVVFVNDPLYKALFAPAKEGLTQELKATCACPLDEIQVSTVGPAGQRISAIVSYAQSHQDVKYIVPAVADMIPGLPEALQSAGLTKRVKLVSRAPQKADIPLLRSGAELANVQDENSAAGWRAIDALARVTVDAEPEPNAAGYHAILTQSNLTSNEIPAVPGIPDSYLKAWQLK
jgi:hypothetical protein